MKVVLISNLYEKYRRGGAEGVVQSVAEGLNAKGHEVCVISASPHQIGNSIEFENGLKIRRFYPPNIYFYSDASRHSVPVRMLWTLFDTFNFVAAWRVKRIVLEENPDLILIHNLKGIGYLVPRLLGRYQSKSVLTLHDVQLANPSGLIIWGKKTIGLILHFWPSLMPRPAAGFLPVRQK